MNSLSPAMIGFIRGLFTVIVAAVVLFLSNAANLHGVLPDGLAAIISALALAYEHVQSAGTNTALFGAVTTKRIQ